MSCLALCCFSCAVGRLQESWNRQSWHRQEAYSCTEYVLWRGVVCVACLCVCMFFFMVVVSGAPLDVGSVMLPAVCCPDYHSATVVNSDTINKSEKCTTFHITTVVKYVSCALERWSAFAARRVYRAINRCSQGSGLGLPSP